MMQYEEDNGYNKNNTFDYKELGSETWAKCVFFSLGQRARRA